MFCDKVPLIMRSKNASKSQDPKVAIVTADAFRKHALIFVNDISGSNELVTVRDKAAVQLGELIASATEMSFAIELYLKALWIRCGRPVPDEHNLWSLFKNRPVKSLRDSIAATYTEQLNRKMKAGQVAGINLRISVTGTMNGENTDDGGNDAVDKPRMIDVTLKRLLKDCSNAFITWRYLYEKATPGKYLIITYPFQRLNTAAEILRKFAIQEVTVDSVNIEP
jgi:hypothetical protein